MTYPLCLSTSIYSGTSLLRTLQDLKFIIVHITVVSSIQRSFNALQYYTGTQNGVLIIEISTFQRFVIERSHCIHSPYACSKPYQFPLSTSLKRIHSSVSFPKGQYNVCMCTRVYCVCILAINLFTSYYMLKRNV